MEGLVYVFNNFHSSALVNIIMKHITLLGDGGLIWFIFAAVMLCFKKTRVCACVMLVSLGVGHLLNEYVLKLIFSRPRPFSVHPEFADFIRQMGIDPPGSYSFPSGHSFSAFNAAMVIFLFHKKIGVGALSAAALIAFSRVFFCIHYPTDVLAGMILGLIVAFCSYVAYKGILRLVHAQKRKGLRKID